MDSESVFYFAYGSNADPDRFRKRVGKWRSRVAARLEDHRLRFASSVRSEGGGGAVVDRCSGSHVEGVLFEITADQLTLMDREEFDESRDESGLGQRVQGTVQTGNGPVNAELYTVEDDGGWRPPSERYLGYILTGLEDAGHDREALDRVRGTAEQAVAERRRR